MILILQKVENQEGEVKAAEKRIREAFSAQIEEMQQECKQIPKLNIIISEQKRYFILVCVYVFVFRFSSSLPLPLPLKKVTDSIKTLSRP